MKVFIVLLLVAVTFAFEIRERPCPTNKTWGGFGDCPDSCYNTNYEDHRPCTLKLNIGCGCAPGYILLEDRDSSSNCIKPEDCPEVREEPCPANKTWGGFGDCPDSCYNTNNEDNRPCTGEIEHWLQMRSRIHLAGRSRFLFQLHQTRGLPMSMISCT